MLYLSTKLYEIPLLSVRSGGRIGTVLGPIINPHNLHIDGFYCILGNTKETIVLLDIYIRDITARGIIIDDHENLSTPEELVRLQPILKLRYELHDKLAIVNKKKIGKITDFAVDDASWFIQKLYVQPRIWNSLGQERLTFDRLSVVEVTDSAVSFSGPEVSSGVTLPNFSAKPKTDYSASASLMSE